MVFSRRPRQSEIRCTKCHDLISPRSSRKGNKFAFFAASLPKFNVTVMCRLSLRPTPEKIGNGGFTVKTHKMFSVPYYAGQIGHFGFVFKENSGRQITSLSWHPRAFKIFPSTPKYKTTAFKFLRFGVRSRKSAVFKFCSQNNTSRPFLISSVWRAFSKSSNFMTDFQLYVFISSCIVQQGCGLSSRLASSNSASPCSTK